jgi:hypothetical protein
LKHGRSPARTAAWALLAAIAFAATAARFYRTDLPLGFYRDEAAIAGNAMCLAESGRTLDGAHWPLVTQVLGGGHSSVVWLAPVVLWNHAIGASIPAERAFAALCGTVVVAGVFFLGWFATNSRRIGGYAALAAAVSPWAFQFSRVAWDAAIAPAYLVWALALLCWCTSGARRTESRWVRWITLTTSALLFAATCISYPPLRVEVPLVLLAFVIWKRSFVRERLPEAALFTLVFVAATADLWLMTANGTIQSRYNELSVFNAAYWADRGVTSHSRIAHGMWLFVKNLFAHFSPTYLFVSGDAQPRHSTQSFGEWSWLDGLALACAAIIAALRRARPSGWLMFAAFGYLAGVIPAALTWEGVPHALRSIGALPFLFVIVGSATNSIGDRVPRVQQLLPAIASVVAASYFVAYSAVFFGSYAAGAGDAFDVEVVQKLLDPEFIDQVVAADRAGTLNVDDAQSYPALALRYYELRTGGVRCHSGGPVLGSP